jgi:hypothetical protein
MQDLKLKIKRVGTNGGALLLVPADPLIKVEEKKGKGKSITIIRTQVHPSVRLVITPQPDDKTKYSVGDVYNVTLTKTK